MLHLASFCLLLVAASALPVPAKEEVHGPPEPYSYSYKTEGDGTRVSRSESTSGNGIIIGSYTIAGDDGLLRVVEYTAGPDGFQANIKTNEPGTKQENSAGVQIEANPIEVPETLTRAVQPIALSTPIVRPAVGVARPTVAVAQPNPALSYISSQPQPHGQQGAGYVLVPLDSLRNFQQ